MHCKSYSRQLCSSAPSHGNGTGKSGVGRLGSQINDEVELIPIEEHLAQNSLFNSKERLATVNGNLTPGLYTGAEEKAR